MKENKSRWTFDRKTDARVEKPTMSGTGQPVDPTISSPEKRAVRALKTPAVSPDQWKIIFEQLGLLVVFFPEKWRKLAIAVVAAVGAVTMAFVGYQTLVSPAPTYYQASALTPTQADLTLRVPANGGPAKVVSADSNSRDAAPLMDWNNLDVREGRTQRWYINPDTDPRSQVIFRELFNELAAMYPNNIKWQEVNDPKAPYNFGATAQTDCGIGDEAVACAVYYGPRGGRVSYNANFRGTGVLGDAALRVAIAHEFQHIVLNLDHNPCGIPVRSAMTPIDLRGGSSCSNPPAFGIVVEDHEKAIPYYNLKPAAFNPPTPRCKEIHVSTQRWTVGTGGNEWNVSNLAETKDCIREQSWFVIAETPYDGQTQWSQFLEENP